MTNSKSPSAKELAILEKEDEHIYETFNHKFLTSGWNLPPVTFKTRIYRHWLLVKEVILLIWFYITILPFIATTGYLYYFSNKKNIIKNVSYSNDKLKYLHRRLDVYASKRHEDCHTTKTNSELQPVVVFIYGGAWGSGDKQIYAKMGHILKQHNITTVIPNYGTWPTGGVEEMIADISQCLRWTVDNIENYGGNPKQITIIGHSAGAHLAVQFAIKRSLFLSDQMKLLGPYSNVCHQFDQTGLNINAIIGISGVYDIIDHYFFEFYRGVEHLSTMKPAMRGTENFHHHSPSLLIRELFSLKSNPLQYLPPIHLFHGIDDMTVPYKSSEKLYHELKNAGCTNCSFHTFESVGHSRFMFSIMEGKHPIALKKILGIVQAKTD